MIYRYTYKITCTKGSFKDKFYFGQHKTKNLDDGYKGSGKLLLAYYKKYPNDYIKEILEFYNSKEDLDKAEYELIHPYLNNLCCLNQRDGGTEPTLGNKQKEKIAKSLKEYYKNPENRKKAGEKNKGKLPWNKELTTPEKTRKKQSEVHKGKSPWNKDKLLSDNHKMKISVTLTQTMNTPEIKEKCRKSHLNTHRVYDNPEHTKWHMEKNK